MGDEFGEAAVASPTKSSAETLSELIGQTQEDLDAKREAFESTHHGRASVRKKQSHSKPADVDRFLSMMSERGGGNIALAWRRYFDSDGDGELDFREFCGALTEMSFLGDVPRLWIDLGGMTTGTLTLHSLDPKNAAVLEAFGHWCVSVHGGPMEVFTAIDADGSDSLTPDEFAEGLREIGFFEVPALPAIISTEEGVLANLFPLLDQTGHGCITSEQLLFLEKDKTKKDRLQKEIERQRKFGKVSSTEPLANEAQQMLHNLAIGNTLLGGKHWKTLKSPMAVGYKSPQHRRRTAPPTPLSQEAPTSPSGAAQGGEA